MPLWYCFHYAITFSIIFIDISFYYHYIRLSFSLSSPFHYYCHIPLHFRHYDYILILLFRIIFTLFRYFAISLSFAFLWYAIDFRWYFIDSWFSYFDTYISYLIIISHIFILPHFISPLFSHFFLIEIFSWFFITFMLSFSFFIHW